MTNSPASWTRKAKDTRRIHTHKNTASASMGHTTHLQRSHHGHAALHEGLGRCHRHQLKQQIRLVEEKLGRQLGKEGNGDRGDTDRQGGEAYPRLTAEASPLLCLAHSQQTTHLANGFLKQWGCVARDTKPATQETRRGQTDGRGTGRQGAGAVTATERAFIFTRPPTPWHSGLETRTIA